MSHIERWADAYLQQDPKYSNHIKKFSAYIKKINKDDMPTMVSLGDIEGCISYYNNLGQINTVSSLESHLEAIKSFYKYLVERAWSANIFSQVSDYSSYKESLINKYDLTEAKEREALEIETIKNIIKEMDNYFKINNPDELSPQKRKRYFNYLVLRIFIKINLLIPAKRSVICNLKIGDFSDDFRVVKVNELEIDIPNGLKRDIENGIQKMSKYKNQNPKEELKLLDFLDEGSFKAENLTTWLCNFLREFDLYDIPKNKTTFPIESIRNSALIEMIINGIDIFLLAKLSGVQVTSLERWYFKVNPLESSNIKLLASRGISSTSYYSYL